jgi:GNAT superfamily N-acetyltransferase
MDPNVRRLAADDWQALRSTRLSALLDSPEAYKRRHADEATLHESCWRSLFSSSIALLLAELDGEPVGLVAGIGARPDDIDPQAVHLGSMWVAPSARGRGVADELSPRWSAGHARRAIHVWRCGYTTSNRALRRSTAGGSPKLGRPGTLMTTIGPCAC